MGRPLRHQDADTLYLVSNECFESRCILRPDAEVTSITRRWLRRAIDRHEVEVFGTMFVRNRFVMIVRAPKLNLHNFMGYFQGNLARKVNVVRGREGSVFPKRYHSEALLDDEAIKQAWLEMMAMPVEERLVDDPRAWIGVHSASGQLGAASDDGIALTRLPMFADDAEQAKSLAGALEDHLCEVRKSRPQRAARCRTNKRRRREARPDVAPGCRQHWRWRPQPRPHARRSTCRGNTQARSNHCEAMERVRTRYTDALAAWRGGRAAAFPAGTLPPGWLQCARAAATTDDDEPARDAVTAG